MLGQAPPPARHPWSCGGAGGGGGGAVGARSRLQAAASTTQASSQAWLSLYLRPAGPALLLGLPKTTLQSHPGPGATCQPHGCPTPTVLQACGPAKPQLPLQLPRPTAAPSPFQVLTPNRPSKTPLPAASTLPSQAPAPTATLWPKTQVCAFQTFPRGPRLGHTCCVPWEGLVPDSGGREPEEHLGAKGLAVRGKGWRENRAEVEGRQQRP